MAGLLGKLGAARSTLFGAGYKATRTHFPGGTFFERCVWTGHGSDCVLRLIIHGRVITIIW